MWQQTFLVIYFLLNAVGTVALIGKRREPITPGVAAFAVLVYAALIYFVVMSL